MIATLGLLLISYWVLASGLAFFMVSKAFRKYRNQPKIEVPDHYQGFMRQDWGKWNYSAIKKGCFLRFPLKFASLATYLVTLSILSLLHNHLKLPKFIV